MKSFKCWCPVRVYEIPDDDDAGILPMNYNLRSPSSLLKNASFLNKYGLSDESRSELL